MDRNERQTELENKFVKLLENNLDPRKYFTKKKYAAYFKSFCEAHNETFAEIDETFSQLKSQEDKEGECNEKQRELLQSLAEAAAFYAKQEIEKCRGFSKGNRQAELNLFMVTSVFPCALELGKMYGESLCQELASQWKQTFHGVELGYQTFEKLNDSFRSAFGFLTGR